MAEPHKYFGIRLTWSGKEWPEDKLGLLWQNIPSYQEAASKQVQQIPGVDYFISSLTATASFASGKPTSVNPGIAFWIVTDAQFTNELLLFTRLRKNPFGAALRMITMKKTTTCEEVRQLNNLAITLKDSCYGYIQQRIESETGMSSARNFICVNMAGQNGTKYRNILQQAGTALQNWGLSTQLDEYSC